MKKLNYELKNLVKRNRDGSHATQADRHHYLQQIANQLHKLGYKNMGVTSLKMKHVYALIELWQEEISARTGMPISNGSIKNRMSTMRWWASKVDKPTMIPRTNKALGIEDRKRLPEVDRAFTLTDEQRKDLPIYLRLSLRLQQEFGLRREAAAKFILAKAEFENHILLLKTWTKSGRARKVAIVNDRQRALLDDIREYSPRSSLIPDHMNYGQYVSHRKYLLEGANIPAPHGLRHHWAQQRYLELTNGLLPPRLGGQTYSKLTKEERELDLYARKIVSSELGHVRLDITRVYLG